MINEAQGEQRTPFPEELVSNPQARLFAARLRRSHELLKTPGLPRNQVKLANHLGYSAFHDLDRLGFGYLARQIVASNNPKTTETTS